MLRLLGIKPQGYPQSAYIRTPGDWPAPKNERRIECLVDRIAAAQQIGFTLRPNLVAVPNYYISRTDLGERLERFSASTPQPGPELPDLPEVLVHPPNTTPAGRLYVDVVFEDALEAGREVVVPVTIRQTAQAVVVPNLHAAISSRRMRAMGRDVPIVNPSYITLPAAAELVVQVAFSGPLEGYDLAERQA